MISIILPQRATPNSVESASIFHPPGIKFRQNPFSDPWNPGARFSRGMQKGIQKRKPAEESRSGIPARNPERNPEEESGRGILERNPSLESREESRRGIQKGIQKRKPAEESRSGIPARNPERNPEEESGRGILELNPSLESREESRRGIQARNPERNPGEECRCWRKPKVWYSLGAAHFHNPKFGEKRTARLPQQLLEHVGSKNVDFPLVL